MNIKQRLRLFVEMYGDIPVRDDFARNLCQDARAEIEQLEKRLGQRARQASGCEHVKSGPCAICERAELIESQRDTGEP